MAGSRNAVIVLICMIINLLPFTSALSREFIFESAAGFGSSYTPLSDNWRGDVTAKGLSFREFALRGTYQVTDNFSLRSTFGWIKELDHAENVISPTYLPPDSPIFGNARRQAHRVGYFIPSIIFTSQMVRLDFGAVIYGASNISSGSDDFVYPFNGIHRFRPSIGLELCENTLFIYGRISDSFPFHSGGGIVETGFGGRISGLYEHKVYLSFDPVSKGSLGYRGETRIYGQTALSFGACIGVDDNGLLLTATAGIKIMMGI